MVSIFYLEILGKMHLWLINECISSDFIESILSPDFLQKAMFVLVIDLSKPGEIVDQLKKWCMYIYEKFSKFTMKIPVDKLQEMIKNIEDYLKLWEEPSDQPQDTQNLEETRLLKLDMPLKEGLLKISLGIPFLFVINKTDCVTSNLDKKRFEEDSEFILKHIRKFAITCKF